MDGTYRLPRDGESGEREREEREEREGEEIETDDIQDGDMEDLYHDQDSGPLDDIVNASVAALLGGFLGVDYELEDDLPVVRQMQGLQLLNQLRTGRIDIGQFVDRVESLGPIHGHDDDDDDDYDDYDEDDDEDDDSHDSFVESDEYARYENYDIGPHRGFTLASFFSTMLAQSTENTMHPKALDALEQYGKQEIPLEKLADTIEEAYDSDPKYANISDILRPFYESMADFFVNWFEHRLSLDNDREIMESEAVRTFEEFTQGRGTLKQFALATDPKSRHDEEKLHSLRHDSTSENINISTNELAYVNADLNPKSVQDSKLPINSQTGFLDWERHNEATQDDITATNTVFLSRHGHGNDDGGVKEPNRPGLSSLDTIDFSSLTREPPGSKFRDSLKLTFIDYRRIEQCHEMTRYKNNIAAVIEGPGGRDVLVTACNARLFFHEFETLLESPKERFSFTFDTRPTRGSPWDNHIATMPHFPHTINYLKVFDDWLGKQVLVACVDDGMILMWYTSTLNEQMEKYKEKFDKFRALEMDGLEPALRVQPDFKIKLKQSAWGVDLMVHTDVHGTKHHLLAAADNSKTVTFCYYHPGDDQFYSMYYLYLFNNVPAVSFVNHEVKPDGTNRVSLAAASITGMLKIVDFEYDLVEGPLTREQSKVTSSLTHYVDYIGSGGFPDSQPLQVTTQKLRLWSGKSGTHDRIDFPQRCWTVKLVDASYFHEVQSLRAMTGDPTIAEEQKLVDIMNQSHRLSGECDPVASSHLGVAAGLQHFKTPVAKVSMHEDFMTKKPLIRLGEKLYRTQKSIKRFKENVDGIAKVQSLNGKKYIPEETFTSRQFLAVTCEDAGAIFHADGLQCVSSTDKIFNLASLPGYRSPHPSDRLSITHVIPELLCFIVVSQQGLASIFRLCLHRGLYGMRQEHVFPSALSLAEISAGQNTICGFSVRKATSSHQNPRYFLYIVYTDSLVITYELKLPEAANVTDFDL